MGPFSHCETCIMGEWATFDWSQLDTHSLVCILSNFCKMLADRLLERYPFPAAAAAPTVGSPTGSFSVVGDSRGEGRFDRLLITPFRCHAQDVKVTDTIRVTTAGR